MITIRIAGHGGGDLFPIKLKIMPISFTGEGIDFGEDFGEGSFLRR